MKELLTINHAHNYSIQSGYAVSIKCKGCKTCIDMCPVGAIKCIKAPAYINQELCIKCGSCASVCDHHAIFKINS